MEEHNLPIIYSNMAQVIHSKKDFAVTFGVISPPDKYLDEKEKEIRGNYVPLARVFMSPPQFKALVNVFNTQLKKYEENFGEIIDTQKESSEDK